MPQLDKAHSRPRSLFVTGSVVVLILAVGVSAIFSLSERDDHIGATCKPLKEYISACVGFLLRCLLSTYGWMQLSPYNGTLVIQGIYHPVDIVRDEFGMPHIYGNSFEDVLFAQGFVHAQDRLFDMELARRVALGRLSELVGETALNSDRFLRTLGFEHLSIKDWAERKGSRQGSLLSAYVRGMNAYLRSDFFRHPLELTLLGSAKPREWTEVDCLAVNLFRAWQMCKGWSFEITSHLFLQTVSEDAARELFPRYPDDLPFHMPEGMMDLKFSFNAEEHKSKEQKRKAAQREEEMEDDTKEEEQEQFLDSFDGAGGGSNAWVVSGLLTETGKPLLHNDPHLPLKVPGIWYPIHLSVHGGSEGEREMDVFGGSLCGAPGVVVGRNKHIAWGVTLGNVDVEDLFIEKFITNTTYEYKGEVLSAKVRQELIYVKNQEQPFIENVIETVHGPIISDFLMLGNDRLDIAERLALSSAPLKLPVSILVSCDINAATNWEEFVSALNGTSQPPLNVLYADENNNIGYYLASTPPIRKKGDGSLPVPGWTGEYDWAGYIPFEEMPHVLNPESGYIISANHKIVGPEYPYFLGHAWSQGIRAARIHQLFEEQLARNVKFTVQDFVRFQMDVKTVVGEEITKEVIETLQAHKKEDGDIELGLRLLKEWDYYLDAKSAAACVYEVMKHTTLRNIFQPTLGDDLMHQLIGNGYHPLLRPASEYLTYDSTLLLQTLQNSSSVWMAKIEGGKTGLLLRSLKESIQWLRTTLGEDPAVWQWGTLHPTSYRHPLGHRRTLLLDRVFNVGPYSVGGDNDTPYMTLIRPDHVYHCDGWAPSLRHIADLADGRTAYFITGPGQSGNLGSPHFRDTAGQLLQGSLQRIELGTMRELVQSGKVEGIVHLSPSGRK